MEKKSQPVSADAVNLDIIAYVRTRELSNQAIKDPNLVSKIEFIKPYYQGLRGIDEFSHAYLIFWMNRIKQTSLQLALPGSNDGSTIGIYATRSPVRPNHLGQSVVELVELKDNCLWVRGLDAFDGTPVLDIKPYPNWNRKRIRLISDFRIPQWLSNIVNAH